MKFNCGSKAFWLPMLLVGGLAFVLLPLLIRITPAPEATPSTSPREPAVKIVEPALPNPPAAPAPPAPSDPLLRQWQLAIRQHDAKGVLDAQSTFHARQEDYREPLVKMAKEDPEDRVRAFSIAALGRMKWPPPEEFFIDRLGDAHEYPRTSALNALERIGTAACLPKVDSLASSDPAEAVRAAAGEAGKAVRSR
jgi:hypothetical protein